MSIDLLVSLQILKDIPGKISCIFLHNKYFGNGPMVIQITPASVPAKAFVIIEVTMVEFNVFRKKICTHYFF